jgi:hypothetical protein
MAESPIDSMQSLSPLTPIDTTSKSNLPCSRLSTSGTHPLLATPPLVLLLPTPHLPLRPPSNMSAHEFMEDYRYVLFNELLDADGGNHLPILDNIHAL